MTTEPPLKEIQSNHQLKTIKYSDLSDMVPFDWAQIIDNNFAQSWAKHCDKKSVELDAKGEDALASWWKDKCINPYYLTQKENHHTFLKEFLKSLINENNGSIQINKEKKKESLKADDGVEIPKLIQAPTLIKEEISAYAKAIHDFCKKPDMSFYEKVYAERPDILERCKNSLQNIHDAAPRAIRNLLSGMNVLLTGPAGCGKSTLAEQIHWLMMPFIGFELTFYDMNAGPSFTEFDYLGKAMPMANEEGGQGKLAVIRSPFITGFIKGYSLCFIDEIAVVRPEVNIALNSALEQRRIFDPASGETVEAGDYFFFLCADNTDLTGPTPEYPTRRKQDDAFVSRFMTCRIHMDYDLALEKKILDPRVFKLLQDCRNEVKNKKVNVELSTRLGIKMTRKIESALFTFEECIKDWADELPVLIRKQIGLSDLLKLEEKSDDDSE